MVSFCPLPCPPHHTGKCYTVFYGPLLGYTDRLCSDPFHRKSGSLPQPYASPRPHLAKVCSILSPSFLLGRSLYASRKEDWQSWLWLLTVTSVKSGQYLFERKANFRRPLMIRAERHVFYFDLAYRTILILKSCFFLLSYKPSLPPVALGEFFYTHS